MTEYTQENLFSLFHRVVRLMARAHHQLAHSGPGKGERGRHGSHAQARVLSVINEKGAISQRELMDILQIRSSSVSELVFKLEDYGLIVRDRDEQDKRTIIVSLTEEGKAVVAEHEGHIREQCAGMFTALDEAERQTLAGLLTKLVAALEAEYGGSRECGKPVHGGCGRRGLMDHDHHHHGGPHCEGHHHAEEPLERSVHGQEMRHKRHGCAGRGPGHDPHHG